MKNKEFFKNKNILIVGLARSGLACANLLCSLGANVFVTDNQENDSLKATALKLNPKIKLELGGHSESFVNGKDLVVISPGVSESSQAIIWARSKNIPVISEIECAYRLCEGEIISVTGSNGKTTTTTLIGKIIDESGKRAFVCGNIGKPFTSIVSDVKKDDYVVLEVSSFQLETIETFKPKIAVILNFSKNHLDRYKSIDEYFAAKKRIFLNQGSSDYLVLNSDDPILKKISREAKSKCIFFSKSKEFNPNQEAVIAVGSILGIDRNLCSKVFKAFKGLEHRCEQVAQIRGVTFINDSKATTVESCMWALENIHSPVILIAGGRHKGVDYSQILDLAQKKVKSTILVGEASKIISDAFKGKVACEVAKSMPDAVEKAFKLAKSGDCVLLSPMCSSFDMFLNYEERGRVFKEAVNVLKGKDNKHA